MCAVGTLLVGYFVSWAFMIYLLLKYAPEIRAYYVDSIFGITKED